MAQRGNFDKKFNKFTNLVGVFLALCKNWGVLICTSTRNFVLHGYFSKIDIFCVVVTDAVLEIKLTSFFFFHSSVIGCK